ncbi:MAG: hypothetical protein RR630_05155 [Coprobacillus sp.]
MVIELFDDLDLKLTVLNKETEKFIEGFNCGNLTINNYLKLNGTCFEIAKTYILIDQISSKTIGFFSLCADTLLEREKNGIMHFNSAIRINMFAIDTKYQGKRDIGIDGTRVTFAHFLLIQCFKIIREIAENYIGASYITLYSTLEGLNLYKEVGKLNVVDDEYMMTDTVDNIQLTPMYREIFDYD